MATVVQKVVACSLADIGSIRLGSSLIHPFGICVHKDMLVITDYFSWEIKLYRLHDGELLAESHQLDSRPFNICFINEKEICATTVNGTIEIMSVGDKSEITSVRQLRLTKSFESCQGIVRLKENIAVCGNNGDAIFWCIVSLNNEPTSSTHRVCKGRHCNLTAKDNTIYILCDNSHDDSSESGVYGYDIHNPIKHTVLYKHDDLNFPKGITVDSEGYLFVCNFIPPCIHHLTDKCELLVIYRERIPIRQPFRIFWDNDIMYATYIRGTGHQWENLVARYKLQYSHEQGDHTVSELKDELKHSFIEEAPTEEKTQLQRRCRISYGNEEVVYLKPGEDPSIVTVKYIQIPESSELQTGTLASTQQEESTTSRTGDNTTPDVEVIYQRNQHGSEEPQTETEQHVTEDPHTHIMISEEPKSHTEQLVTANPYAQAEQRANEDPYISPEQRVENIDLVEETCLISSDQTVPEECPKSLQERTLPPGKKYHAFFSYASPDIQWVKKTVKKLEKDHGFVCREYDRDNTPGTPLMTFADDSIRDAYKTVVVMTREAFQSGFVLHEIQMAIIHGHSEKRNCVVPVLVEDCDIPTYLKVLNYVDARDTKRSNIWWPRLLMELEYDAGQETKTAWHPTENVRRAFRRDRDMKQTSRTIGKVYIHLVVQI